MLYKNNILKKLQDFRSDHHGGVAVIFALMAIPLTFATGMAVDYGRMVMNRSSLQNALDGAVMAGASQYSDPSNTSNPINAANNYFNKYKATQFANDFTASTDSGYPKALSGKTSSGYGSYNVQMAATGTIQAYFLPVLGIKTLTIHAYAEAANPLVQPQVTFGPLGSTAADYNALFMYGVPAASSGNGYDYTKYPPLYKMYEAGTNCSSVDGNYSSASRCNNAYGAKPQSGNDTILGTIPSSQPIAFVFLNMNNGMMANGNNGYGKNQWNSQPGYYELMATAPLANGNTPTQYTNNERSWIYNQLYPGFDIGASQPVATSYPTSQNCSVQIQLVTDPNNPPTSPPYPGQCLSPTDPRSGSQYANLSCDQMAGRTFMYWWNDMGGNPDDYNYHDMYYTLKCVAGAIGNNGGTFSNPAPTSSQYLQLVK